MDVTLWKLIQKHTLPQELAAAREGQPAPSGSRLSKIMLKLDPNGLLRVERLLTNSDLPTNVCSPIATLDSPTIMRVIKTVKAAFDQVRLATAHNYESLQTVLRELPFPATRQHRSSNHARSPGLRKTPRCGLPPHLASSTKGGRCLHRISALATRFGGHLEDLVHSLSNQFAQSHVGGFQSLG